MRTLITGGTIVNADTTVRADVLVDGERIALIGEAHDVPAEPLDATGKWVIPGGIDVHTHMRAAVRRHVRQGHLRDRDPRGGLRRDDDDHRLRGAAAWRHAAPGPRHVAREGRRQGLHRLRLPLHRVRHARRPAG